MKREDLKKLLGEAGTDDVLDKIMAMNGSDIEAHKTAAIKAGDDLKAVSDQLKAANDEIKKFKDLKPEELQGKVAEWETKYNQLVDNHKKESNQRLFDGALEKGLVAAKAKNPLTLKPLLDIANLKYNEADGSLIGLKDQLDKIKADEKNGFLFEPEDGLETPTIVVGTKGTQTKTDPVIAALRIGAGLSPTSNT